MKKVCSKTAVWIFALMLMIPGSVLSAEDPPSDQDHAAREAQPVAATRVLPALHQALASSLSEATSIGAKVIPAPPTGTWGIVSAGDGGGGIFRDSDSEAEAWLGTNEYGVMGFGSASGGYFADSDGTSYANVGYGDFGIQAYGDTLGGVFADANSSGYVYAGWGDEGILAAGNLRGGHFYDADSSGYAYVGYGDLGIEAKGNEMGGYFEDSNSSGIAAVAYRDRGIQAFGDAAGGYFKDSDSQVTRMSGMEYGIEAYGTAMGGYFEDSDNSGLRIRRVWRLGAFRPSATPLAGTSMTVTVQVTRGLGIGDRGIEARGKEMGGYFEDSDQSGSAYIGYWRVRHRGLR